MKKNLFTIFLLFFSAAFALASKLSEEAARQLASDFMSHRHLTGTRAGSVELTRAVTGIADGPDARFYVFNSESAFVIVKADDQLPAVIAYSGNGVYDSRRIPSALKAILSSLQVSEPQTNVVTRASDINKHPAVATLISTHWDQKAPFNLLCPMDDETHEQSATGCVATAMAQVMNYHRHPSNYEWDQMKDVYNSSEVGKSALSVAKLMLDCGNSVGTQYHSEGSSALLLMPCEALRYSFNYAETTEYVEREDFTAREWDELVYNEISNGRPVLYGAQCVSPDTGLAGHEFIVDGYDGEGYYHINWGWSGLYDTYFKLSLLNPTVQGSGGNVGSGGYTINQNAIIGIQPSQTSSTSASHLYLGSIGLSSGKKKKTLLRQNTFTNFPAISMESVVYNIVLPEKTRKYDIAFALFKGKELIKVFDQLENRTIKYEYGVRFYTTDMGIGKGLQDDTYQIRTVCRESGQKDWAVALNSYGQYIELTINGLEMTVNTVGLSQEEDSRFIVNSVDLGNVQRVNRTLRITANVSDYNTVANLPLYLWGNAEGGESDKYQLLSGEGTNLDPGQTGEVLFEYIPQRSGIFKMILAGSATECDSTAFYTFEVNVQPENMSDVSVSIMSSAEGAVIHSRGYWQVAGDVLKGEVCVTNTGVEEYNDYMYISLLDGGNDGKSFYFFFQDAVPVKLAVGATLKVPFEYKGLELSTYYGLNVLFMEKGKTKSQSLNEKGQLMSSFIYFMSDPTGIRSIESGSGEVDVYNLQGQMVGKVSELSSMPRGVYIVGQKKIFNK